MVLTQDHGKAFYPIDSWATMENLTVPRVAREWLVGSYLMTKGNAAAINIPWPEDAAPRNLSVQLSWPEYCKAPTLRQSVFPHLPKATGSGGRPGFGPPQPPRGR